MIITLAIGTTITTTYYSLITTKKHTLKQLYVISVNESALDHSLIIIPSIGLKNITNILVEKLLSTGPTDCNLATGATPDGILLGSMELAKASHSEFKFLLPS